MTFREFKIWLEGFKSGRGNYQMDAQDIKKILEKIDNIVDYRATSPIVKEPPFKDIFKEFEKNKKGEDSYKKYVGPWVEPVKFGDTDFKPVITCDVKVTDTWLKPNETPVFKIS